MSGNERLHKQESKLSKRQDNNELWLQCYFYIDYCEVGGFFGSDGWPLSVDVLVAVVVAIVVEAPCPSLLDFPRRLASFASMAAILASVLLKEPDPPISLLSMQANQVVAGLTHRVSVTS